MTDKRDEFETWAKEFAPLLYLERTNMAPPARVYNELSANAAFHMWERLTKLQEMPAGFRFSDYPQLEFPIRPAPGRSFPLCWRFLTKHGAQVGDWHSGAPDRQIEWTAKNDGYTLQVAYSREKYWLSDDTGKRQSDPLPWMSIDRAVRGDQLAVLYFSDGTMMICSLEHDAEFEWWKSRGAEKFFYLNPPKD